MRDATVKCAVCSSTHKNFNPRIPCGMRRRLNRRVYFLRLISIHASHAGCDFTVSCLWSYMEHFNPRIPCGMRQPPLIKELCKKVFQSTHPMRDATDATSEGGQFFKDFNPRIPCGMRLSSIKTAKPSCKISIHASHAGCD